MRSFLFIICIFTIISCKKNKVIIEDIAVPMLRASSITNYDSAHQFLTDYGDKNAEIAKQYFEKGIALEKENVEKSIWHLKRAITLYPTLKYYQELSRVLADNKQYNEAFSILELLCRTYYTKNESGLNGEYYLFERPDFETYYKYVIAGLNSNFAYVDFYLAENIGVDLQQLKNRLLKDPLFPFKEGTKKYEEFLLIFLSENEFNSYSKDLNNFNKFLTSIDDLPNAFEISKKTVQKFNYNSFNGQEYNEMEFEGYSLKYVQSYFLKEKKDNPETWLTYNMVGKKNITDSVLLILYAVDTSATACQIDMRHIYIHAITYSVTGEIIDSKIIAWQSGESLATASINGNKILVDQFKRTWFKPYEKYEFDNEIIAIIPTSNYSLTINTAGAFLSD